VRSPHTRAERAASAGAAGGYVPAPGAPGCVGQRILISRWGTSVGLVTSWMIAGGSNLASVSERFVMAERSRQWGAGGEAGSGFRRRRWTRSGGKHVGIWTAGNGEGCRSFRSERTAHESVGLTSAGADRVRERQEGTPASPPGGVQPSGGCCPIVASEELIG
jgi:hypothetical protein